MIDNKNNQNSTAKSYLVNVGGKTEVWDEAIYTELKDSLYSKYPDAKMFEMDNMTDFSAVDDEMQYVVNTGDRTETWDAATMKELGSALKKKYPNATVQSLKYKDYWYDKAIADEEKMKEMKPQLDSLEEQLSMPRFRDASKPDSLKMQYDEMKSEYDALMSAYDSNPRVIAYKEEMAAAEEKAAKELPSKLRSRIGSGMAHLAERHEEVTKAIEDDKSSIDHDSIKEKRDATRVEFRPSVGGESKSVGYYNAATTFLDAYDYLKGNKSSVAQGAWYNLYESASSDANNKVHEVLKKLETSCGNLNEITTEDIEYNLTDAEKVLLESYFLVMGEEAKTSKAFRGGEIAGESLKMAAEMIVYDAALNILLPGAGTAAGAGSKAARVSSAIAKWYNSGSKLAKLGKGVLKASGEVAKMGAKSAAFTALAPTTYSHIAKKKLTIGDDGKLKDSDEDIMRYFAEDVVENFTELSGEGVLKLFGKAGDLAKGTRIGAKIADRMDSSWFGKAGKWLATNSGTKWFKRAGFHGLPVEVFEEFEGAVINQFTGLDENAISNFADKDNLTTMMIGFAPMTLLGMGSGIGTYAYASHSVNKNAKNLSKVLLDNGYSEEQVNYLINYERQMTPESLGKEINNVLAVMEQNGASAEAKKAVTDYAVAVGRYKALEGSFEAQQPKLKNKKLNELNSKYGTFYQTKNDGKNKLDEVTTTYVLPQGETKGRDVFIVSEKNDNGQYDAIDVNTGERLKVSDSEFALLRNEDSSPVFFTRSLDTYLTERVMEERKKTLSDYEAAYENGQEMTVADLSSLNEQEQQAKDNLLNTGITSRENSFTEDSINLSSSELLSLSEQDEFTEEESNAIRELAIAKRTNEGLIDKLKQPIISSIDSRNSIASNASNNGTLTVGTHNGKTVYVKGGVQTSNGSIVKPDNAKGYPVEIVDAATGEVSVVDSKEVTNAGNVNTATWNRSYEVGMIKAFEQKIEELRNAKSPNAILSEVYELVGKKVYLNINDNIILVEVDQILPSMEVLIKGKKGDLGGKSVLAVGIDEFYNMIYRDANGNPVLPKEEQEESEVTDYRGETVSILINGVPASVEVISQDNSSDSIVYEYTDENGNTKRGRSTISEFGKAIEQANEYVPEQPNVPEEASVAETSEHPIEEAPSEEAATEEPVEAPVENIPLDPESINWDELFEQDKEAYFIEMQNQFGEEAVDVLNEEIDAAQSELDALGKAKTKSQNDRIKNRNKKKALQSRIDALNEMVARLTTPAEAPVVEEVTETVEEAPAAQETEATVEVPAEEAPVTPEQPSVPEADTPAEPAAEPAAPVAPNPVADPVAEAKNREERLLSLIERKGVSDALKRDSAFNAGKEVADFFATYSEFEEYEAEAKDLGNYYEDFARGVKASFTNRPSNEPHIGEVDLEVSSEAQELTLDAVLESLDNNIEVEAASDQQAQAMLDVKAELSGIEAMTVYHGSPHKFSAFDHSKMGTGEGAQAHGWGTYVAVNRQTSEEYADVLRGRLIKITRNGFDISGNVKLLPMDAKTPLELIATLIDWHGIDKAKVELELGLKEAEQKYKESSVINSEYRRAKVEMYKNASVLLNSGSWKVEQSLTNLYTVDIPEDSGSNYFGERELTDRQMEMISDACEREGVDFLEVAAISSALSDKREGARLYKALSEVLGSPKDASEFLSRAGFTGIKYTGNVDGDCFVIFNESDAKITGHVEFYQTPNGTVYGWTDGNKIYLTKAGFNPNTPIHEYTHLWAKAMMQKNPKGWNSVKSLLKGTPIWNEVINDPNYSDIKDNEDSVASEALSRLSGSQNAAKMEQMAQQMIDEAKGTMRKAKARGLIQNMKDALAKFWNWVGTNLFKIEKFNTIDEVTDRVLWDLLNKTDLGELSEGQVENQIVTRNSKYENNSVSLSNVSQAIESGVWNDAALNELNKITEDVEDGKAILKRYTSSELTGLLEGGRLLVGASIISRGSERNVSASRGRAKSLEEKAAETIPAITAWAKSIGAWRDYSERSEEEIAHSYWTSGGEAQVFYLGNGKVEKIIGLDYFVDPQLAIDRIAIHNSLFEETQLKVTGFGTNKDGKFAIIVEQPTIIGKHTDNSEIDSYIESIGFNKIDDATRTFANEELYLSDLHEENVLNQNHERYYVIDGDFRLNTPEVGIGGTRQIDDRIVRDDSDNGNVIQRSDRFNPENPDIRFRKGENNTKFVEQFEFKQNNEKQELEYSDEFRRLQEESTRMSGQLVSEKDGVQQAAIRGLVGGIGRTLQRELDRATSGRGNKLRTVVNDSKGTSFDIIENVDGRLFHDIFEIVRTYLPNGELVDLHDNYDDAICYITSDGLAGFAVDKDGNLISVYSLYGKSKKGFLGAIKDFITEAGATHLDGYNSEKQPLAEIYSKVFGWKVASMMDYNMEYDHDNIAENHGMPQVAFMVNTEAEIEPQHFDKDQYDEAVAYQLEQVEKSQRVDAQNAAIDYLAGNARAAAIEHAVNKEASKLGVAVTYRTRSEMPKGHENDKGYYNTKTGEIVICTENNASIADAIQTILHEAVAHKGLRQLMGDRFNEFINRVYNSLDAETKAKVDSLAENHYNGDKMVAMEEYMASLAENENFAETSVWEKIKSIFESIINSILGRNDIKIGDKELRYILKASYNNMANPNTMNTIEGWAKDTNMRNELGINEATPEIMSRTGIDPDAVSSETAKQVYDRAVKEGWQEFQRQFQDAYQPVRIAIEAIQQETGNIPIEDYENYLLIQNQTSSRSRVEIDNFQRKYYEPIVEQVNKIVDKLLEARGMKNNKKNRAEVYAEVRQYMIAKHGLERNEYYRSTKGEDRDYAGLTSLFGFDPTEYEQAEEEAARVIEKFEKELGRTENQESQYISDLWKRINSATDKTLRHSYESGMISRQQYDQIRSMFDFYIPLRGFDETTAEDVYSYARFEGNRFNAAVHKAEGRTSVADDPIATIMNMAESEIAQGNKNRAKQALYNFILNRPVMGENGMQKQNSLMQVEDVWYVKVVDSTGNEVYQIAAPSHEYGETYEDFEERMASLEAEEKAFKSKKGQVDVGKRFQKKRNQNAHYIYLKINGVDKAIYINGDPKAADAVNGTYQQKRQFGEDKFRQINRLISSTFTNYSLEFTARNFFRDMFYSHINMGVKEKDPAYRKTFRKNWRKNNMGTMLKMLKAYRAGEYDNKELNAIESAFVEFMENGGQTGYTLINSVESHKKELEKSLERMRKGSRKGGLKNSTVFKYTLGGIELLNEASELITRFAAFKTSRDMGRSVVESINDAKEITVNFNTKGAQDGTGWMGAVARYFGWSKYFFNASVQGVQNLKAMANANKLKFCGVVGGMMGLGFLMPVITSAIASMLGGDDDEYWNIPEYDRQNNLCICIGGGDYIKIPLPIGFREVYAMGDMTAALAFDKKFSRDIGGVGMDYANKIASIILPINPLEGSANGLSFWNTFLYTALPSSFQFAIQNATNTDWKGAPLQKEYTWNEDDPQWMKAFNNAPDWMVGLSKWCYENINLDGDFRGLDFSPEKLDNTLSNVFGGVYTLIKKTGNGISAAWNEEERNLSNVPLAGVVFGTGIESDGRFVTDAYFDMKEYYDANVNSIKRVASNFGLSLEDIFVKQKGAHHPKIQEIYGNKNFEWMKDWYLGHEGNRKASSKAEKLGLRQLKQDIKDLQKSIAEREERGMSTEKKEEKLIEKQKMFDEYYRDFTYRLLEMD